MNLFKKMLLFSSNLLLRNSTSKIIFYHDVFDQEQNTNMGTPLELFKQHLKIVKKLDFEIVTQITQLQKQIQITFDDGFRGLWECREFFYAQQWRPTVFIAVDLIGKEFYLSREEIVELQTHGFIFQSHTWSHQILTMFQGINLQHELVDSQKFLSDMLGKNVDELCFPVGYFSNAVVDACFAAGYKKLYSSIPGNFGEMVLPNVFKRNLVQFYSPQEFSWVLHGALTPFAKHYQRIHKQ